MGERALLFHLLPALCYGGAAFLQWPSQGSALADQEVLCPPVNAQEIEAQKYFDTCMYPAGKLILFLVAISQHWVEGRCFMKCSICERHVGCQCFLCKLFHYLSQFFRWRTQWCKSSVRKYLSWHWAAQSWSDLNELDQEAARLTVALLFTWHCGETGFDWVWRLH